MGPLEGRSSRFYRIPLDRDLAAALAGSALPLDPSKANHRTSSSGILSLEGKLVEWQLQMNLNKRIDCLTNTVCGEWRERRGTPRHQHGITKERFIKEHWSGFAQRVPTRFSSKKKAEVTTTME
jgi:hypothetical protein